MLFVLTFYLSFLSLVYSFSPINKHCRLAPISSTLINKETITVGEISSTESLVNDKTSLVDEHLQSKSIDSTEYHTSQSSLENESWQDTLDTLVDLAKLKPTSINIVKLCDMIDLSQSGSRKHLLLNIFRKKLLSDFIQTDYSAYVETASFLNSRIPRNDFPNVQDIPMPASTTLNAVKTLSPLLQSSQDLVPDCSLPNITFSESILDKVLLSIFRGLVQKEINYKSPIPGILGLLEEGRHYMTSPEGTASNQHTFVKNTLAGLMTPVLPPFYRIFMSGIIPSIENKDPEWLVNLVDRFRNVFPEEFQSNLAPGKQYGPWFYAPFLTSFITPVFLNFLVGPSHPNRRINGQLGGLVVEKCKFLQESGCKGLCLHQCKIPAQEFFSESLGLPLTVSPNFVTQECQWSWGDIPAKVEEDPSFPKGCLVGCPTREFMHENVKSNTLLSSCNSA